MYFCNFFSQDYLIFSTLSTLRRSESRWKLKTLDNYDFVYSTVLDKTDTSCSVTLKRFTSPELYPARSHTVPINFRQRTMESLRIACHSPLANGTK